MLQAVYRLSFLTILLASAAGFPVRADSTSASWTLERAIRNGTSRTVGVKVMHMGWPSGHDQMKVSIYKSNMTGEYVTKLQPTAWCDDDNDTSDPKDFYLLDPQANYTLRYEGKPNGPSSVFLKIMVMGDKTGESSKLPYKQSLCATTKMVRSFFLVTGDGKTLTCVPGDSGKDFGSGKATYRITPAAQAANAGQFAVVPKTY